jgi:hypothetical protein
VLGRPGEATEEVTESGEGMEVLIKIDEIEPDYCWEAKIFLSRVFNELSINSITGAEKALDGGGNVVKNKADAVAAASAS